VADVDDDDSADDEAKKTRPVRRNETYQRVFHFTSFLCDNCVCDITASIEVLLW
jgi:hypothetical protein